MRAFKPEPLKDGDLEKILDAGRLAPSAGNCQPWNFVVVKDKGVKQDLAKAALGQSSVAEAPVAVVVCVDLTRAASRYGKRGKELYCIQDTAAAVQNMHLAAVALGYGTCWVGAFEEGAVAKVINAPADVRPVAIVPIGRPAQTPSPTPRLSLDEIVRKDTF